jgi:hypothetical protein
MAEEEKVWEAHWERMLCLDRQNLRRVFATIVRRLDRNGSQVYTHHPEDGRSGLSRQEYWKSLSRLEEIGYIARMDGSKWNVLMVNPEILWSAKISFKTRRGLIEKFNTLNPGAQQAVLDFESWIYTADEAAKESK